MAASIPRRRKKVAGAESQVNSTTLQHAVASADQSRPLESGISALTLGLIAAAVGVALYVNTLEHEWTLDDNVAVVGNPDVNLSSPVSQVFEHDFWGKDITDKASHKSYRPLTVLSFRLNRAVASGMLDPWSFHLGNVLLYGMCCFLATLFVFTSNGDLQNGGVTMGAVIASLVFVVHPIHTEAVASVVGRAELLSASFCFVGVNAYQRSKTSGVSWLVVFGVCIVCGMLSKELAIAVPVVCASTDVCAIVHARLRQTQIRGQTIHGAVMRVSVAALIVLGYLVVRKVAFDGDGVTGRFEDNPLRFIPRDQAFYSALYLQTHNLRLLLYPMVLSCDYSFDAIPYVKDVTDPRLVFPTLPFYMGMLVVGVWALHRGCYGNDPRPIVALSWIVFPILPTSHIVTVGLVLAERTLFFPTVGVSLALKWVVDTILLTTTTTSAPSRTRVALVVVLSGALTCGLAVRTVARNPAWESEATLWQSAYEAYPNSVKARYGVARTLKSGPEAQQAFQEILEIYPFHCYSLNTLQKYMQHPYHAKYDLAFDYARRSIDSCYYARGLTHVLAAMKDYVINLDKAATNGNCEAALYLSKAFALDKWKHGFDLTKSASYKKKYQACVRKKQAPRTKT
eukprot:m.175355 g.175355  ORF g.175355 m.175355 type:complete len:625 (+) comp31813_c0_seq1:106-1980(+)